MVWVNLSGKVWQYSFFFKKKNSSTFSHLTFLPPGDEVSGGGVLVMFKGLEPQLEGEDPRILLHQRQPN